jgi:hypothetical protein
MQLTLWLVRDGRMCQYWRRQDLHGPDIYLTAFHVQGNQFINRWIIVVESSKCFCNKCKDCFIFSSENIGMIRIRSKTLRPRTSNCCNERMSSFDWLAGILCASPWAIIAASPDAGVKVTDAGHYRQILLHF